MLLGLLSCKRPQPQNVKKDAFLIGKWENCQELFMQDDGRSISMTRNVCPFIVFDKSNTGYVKMGDAVVNSVFNWSIKNDELIISQYKNTGKPFFDPGAFKLLWQQREKIKEVVLFDTAHKVKYVLER